MIPELAIAVLACARIGVIHSVVFAGFSSQSLRDRLNDSESRCLITSEIGVRRGKTLPLGKMAAESLASNCSSVESVILLSNDKESASSKIDFPQTVYDFETLLNSGSKDFEAEEMDSEDPLFILYTSGTTGKPKGIIHSTGGYLTHAKYSTRAVFDLKDDDIYWCTADIGWITGHTYLLYGPLSNGATVLMFEGTPDFPIQ